MGRPWVVATPEHEVAFARDWALGMPLAEMAALHGFRNVNGVSRTARRLGLPKRPGGARPGKHPPPSPARLEGGAWVRRGLVHLWVES